MPFRKFAETDVLPERTNYDMELERDPTFGDLTKAYFENENIIASVAQKFAHTNAEPDPDYDVFNDIEGYETYADNFIGVENRLDADYIKGRIDKENMNKEVMASGGLKGVGAGLMTGLIDPTMMIPIGGAAYKTYRTGGRILEGAGRTALMTGLVQSGNELVLQSLQETRTAEETGYNIAGATFLGGIIGGAAGAFSKKEIQSLGKSVENELTVPVDVGSTAGAQAVGTTLEQQGLKSTLGLKPLRDKAVKYLKDKNAPDSLVRMAEATLRDPDEFLAFQDPVLRTANSPSVSTRQLSEQLVESPMIRNKNTEGIATEVPVENMIKSYNLPKFQFYKTMDDYFKIHRQSKTVIGPQAHDTAAKVFRMSRKDGKLTYNEFGEEVVKAARRNDTHDIPEVAAAARQLRGQILDPLFKSAKEVGLIDEGTLAPKTAASYVSRLWDTNKIKNNMPDFIEKNTQWLKTKRDRAAADVQDAMQFFKLEDGPIAETIKLEKAALREAGKEKTVAVNKEAKAGTAEKVVRLRIDDLESRLGELTKSQQRIYDKILNGRDRGDDDLQDLFFEFKSVSSRKRDLYKQLTAKEGDAEIKNKAYWRREAIANALADAENALEERVAALENNLKDISMMQYKASFDDVELKNVAYQLTDRILGTPVGRLSYDNKLAGGKGTAAGKRGPAKARVYDIPDELIEDYLVNDIHAITESYVRSLASDIELTKKFGSIDPEETLKKIQDDYHRLMEGKSAEEVRKLKKQMDNDLADFKGMWERLRGTYGNNGADDYASLPKSAERIAMNANYMAMLGGMTISAFSDIARPVMIHGLKNVFGDGLHAMASDWQGFKSAAGEIKEAGTALDMVLGTRAKALTGMDEYQPFSNRAEAVTGKMANSFGVLSLMAPWNTGMKQFTGVVAQSRLVKLSQKLAAGDKLSQGDTEFLAANFIDRSVAKRIDTMFKTHGEDNGALVPNARAWDDIEAQRIFRAAIRRDVDRTIITPGQDKPFLMSKSGWKLMMQFRSFSVASTQRTLLSGLQQRDMAVLNGTAFTTALGMMTYVIKTKQSGNEPDYTLSKLLVEGVDRGGLTGWLMDANNVVEKVSRGRVGVNAMLGGPAMSRYASRSAMEAVFGPTYGMVGNLTQVTGNALAGDWKQSDTHTIRRLMPYQNLFYVRSIFDEAETNINEFYGFQK